MKDELWPLIKAHFSEVVIPHHRTFTLQHTPDEEDSPPTVAGDSTVQSEQSLNSNDKKQAVIDVIEEVVRKVTENPERVSKILILHGVHYSLNYVIWSNHNRTTYY